ncbi:hypothetical protein F7230_02855 [Corynebacterium sp. 320]|uniref:Uncharacterized protein n=1 Tax=Corynebacterium zhongnanshanii TaxID=2768834 RepID=A0ABQ6VFK9_9CORY|nr:MULTISPECIES: hypothetical protein [Corynebacterium]KAB1504052.1 hypothetical protein F7230_02855 [Corynebacterium sp. 320]KAB1552849.1 hypothetical protein F7233_03740 [Corynebacterium sp. 321]KAB1553933.1 hypothetical protein F7232_02845 [Corynebacterium sp. 319]KAB3523093.1 hypothetical protein F8377_02755 [Corynebacterium zhongnanshanii]KAB3528188.1 hypothetical protein F8354_02855 [Corynebacterium sp. 250]
MVKISAQRMKFPQILLRWVIMIVGTLAWVGLGYVLHVYDDYWKDWSQLAFLCTFLILLFWIYGWPTFDFSED